MQNIFGCYGLRTDATFGERHIFGYLRVQVMTHHEHVEVLRNCVYRVGPSRVRRGWQNIWKRGDANNVRRVSSTRAFGMVGVDGSAVDRRDRGLQESRFVDGVGMNGN